MSNEPSELIEEDASTSVDPEQHLKITVDDFLGDGADFDDAGLTTYLNMGAWSPSATPLTVVGGKLDAGARDGTGNPSPETSYNVDTKSGDDLLAAFLYNRYFDDTRDRFDADAEESNKRATPGVDFAPFAQPPKVSAQYDPENPDLTDGEGFFPASADDSHFFYSEPARQRLTEHTPETVGWRDHTEGHRISTTRGDKIEVIGGNYKLIVLGRGSGTAQTDWSGGMVIDALEAPGLVTSVSWREVPTGDAEDEHGWLWVEETVKGHVVERFHGTTRTEHYGDEIITIIGRSDEEADVATASSSDEMGDFGALGDPARKEQRFAELDNQWDGTGGAPPKRQRPRVTSKVRARDVFELERLDDKRISIIQAPRIDFFSGVRPTLDDGTVATDDDGSPTYPADAKRTEIDRDITVADNIKTVVRAREVRSTTDANYYLHHFTGETTLGKYQEYWRGAFREMFVGAVTQLFLAGYFSFGLALRTNISRGIRVHANFGAAVSITGFKQDLQFQWDEIKLNALDFKMARMVTNLNAVEARLAAIKIDAATVKVSALNIHA